MASQLGERLVLCIDQFFLFRSAPELGDMNALLKRTNELIDLIKKKQDVKLIPQDTLKGLLDSYDKIKEQWEFDANGLVGEKNGEKWAEVVSNKKADLYWKIDSIYKALRGLRSSDMCIGVVTFFALLFLLMGSTAFYLYYHPVKDVQKIDSVLLLNDIESMHNQLIDISIANSEQAEPDSNTPDQTWDNINTDYSQLVDNFNYILSTGGDLPDVKNDLKLLGSAISDKKIAPAMAALSRIEQLILPQIKIEENQQHLNIILVYSQLQQLISRLTLFDTSDKTENEINDAWSELLSSYEKAQKALLKLPISGLTQQRLGVLLANINQKNLANARNTVAELKLSIDNDIFNMRETFFYTKDPMKWLEIATWSWFGVLVGVIFYLTKQLKLGVFDRQDVPSILGEIFMAPIVTCVIFFLFDATGITEFSPADDSIVIVLGFAFIFGYAIRRTVGLLDNIKQRLLPSP